MERQPERRFSLCLTSWCIGRSLTWISYPTPVLRNISDKISIDQDKGPGDRGKEGIEDFKKQHHCNDICKVLNLSAFEDVDDNGDELDIYDSTKNKTPPSSDKQLVELYTSNFTPEDV